MKILVVSLFFPYPEVTHAGGTNLFHYIAGLKERGHQISLVSYINSWELPHLDEMRIYCDGVVTLPAISSLAQRLLKSPYLIRNPIQWVEAYSPRMSRMLRDMLSTHKYDVVHFEHLWMAQYYRFARGCTTVLDEVDVDSLVLFRRYRQAHSFWRKVYLWWSWLRTIQMEVEISDKMDLIFTRSEKDRKYMQCFSPGCDIRVLHPWVDGFTRSRLSPELIEPYNLLFVGNMSRAANVDAVLFFYRKIFPKILKAVPGAKLTIVGDSPPETLRQLEGENLIVTGYVKDLAQYYGRCHVFIAPLLTGGGIIIKILEALSAGRPVVCTSVGNEGIEAQPGHDICIADEPDIFADSVIRLLTEPLFWQEIAVNGSNFFMNKYRWDNIIENLEKAYLEKIARVSSEGVRF